MSTTLTQPVVPATQASPKHRQGSYTLPDGRTRVLYAQRVLGHVRLTDEPEHPGKGARAYLIERCIEADPLADGTSAAAHLSALVTDYLDQARRLQACPLERDALLTDTHAVRMLAPKASRATPFSVMLKYGVDTWPEAIALRAEANHQVKAEAEANAEAKAAADAAADNVDATPELVAA
jgi:hypothetical protein